MELFFVLIMSQCGYFLWFFCVGSVFIRKKKCVDYYANDGGRRCGFEILAATPALCLMNMKRVKLAEMPSSPTGGTCVPIKSSRWDLCTNFGRTNQIAVT